MDRMSVDFPLPLTPTRPILSPPHIVSDIDSSSCLSLLLSMRDTPHNWMSVVSDMPMIDRCFSVQMVLLLLSGSESWCGMRCLGVECVVISFLVSARFGLG